MLHDRDKASGSLSRYTLKDGILQVYEVNINAMETWLRRTSPQQKNVTWRCRGRKKNCNFDAIEIHVLDDNAIKLLAAIPPNKDFWTPNGQYRRHIHTVPTHD